MIRGTRTGLLTTRTRIVIAIVVTAFYFAVAVVGAVTHHQYRRLLIENFFGLNGWALIALNVAFFIYVCWLAYSCIRGTAARERLFFVCWFVNILLWPLRALKPEWSTAEHYVSSIALVVALSSAASLLWGRQREPSSDDASLI